MKFIKIHYDLDFHNLLQNITQSMAQNIQRNLVKTPNLFRTVQTEMGAAIVAGIEAGWVNPVINKEYNMDQAAQVHHDIIHSKGAKGKLVLKVAEDMWAVNKY